MAPSQMTTLRVVLFTLTICGALFGVMTSPVEPATSPASSPATSPTSSPATPPTSSPLSIFKNNMNDKIEAIENIIKSLAISATKIDKLKKLKTAIEGLKNASDANQLESQIKTLAGELDVAGVKIKEGTTFKDEAEKVIKADRTKDNEVARTFISSIETATNAISISNEELTNLKKPIDSLIEYLETIKNLDIGTITNDAKEMKAESGKTSTDATKLAETVTAILKMVDNLKKVKGETDKVTEKSAGSITTTTAAPNTTGEASFFSGSKLVIIIVVAVIALVGIVGAVFYCMKNRD